MDYLCIFIVNPRSSKFPTDAWVLALVLLILTNISAQDLYDKHCEGFLPAPQTVRSEQLPFFEQTKPLGFFEAPFTGGDSLFNDTASVWNSRSKFVTFALINCRKTDKKDVLKILGQLTIRSGVYGIEMLTVSADGFWSFSSGRACMVASPHLYFSPRFLSLSVRFSYPRVSNILGSVMNGTVESLDEANSFEPIRISVPYEGKPYEGVYEYTRVKDAIRVCKDRNPDVVGDVLKGGGVCSLWDGVRRTLMLELNSDCHGVDCTPFSVSDPPNSLFIRNLQCTQQGQVHGVFKFSHFGNLSWRNEVPRMILVGEGQWDEKKGQLCMVACRVGRNLSEEEDCGISISMQFHKILTVSSRDVVVGHVQSERKVPHFKNLAFRGSTSINYMEGGPGDLDKLEYKYTKLEKVKLYCSNIFMDRKMVLEKKSDWKYPDVNFFQDLGFDAWVSIPPKERRYVNIYPFTIGDKFEGVRYTDKGASDPLNVSYNLQFGPPYGSPWDEHFQTNASSQPISSISAEGIYDPQTGTLCMIGCRHINNQYRSIDCELLIEMEYAPTNPELFAKEHLSGKITSLRTQTDPFYFKPMKLSSIHVYRDQSKRTVWRKDLEIIMGLVSLSFTALFIISQLMYIKKHPTSLPFVSLLMLTVLTLGHMIPLVLNFEAVFTSQKEKDVFEASDGGLKSNEVFVRVITMFALLCQLRLLQLAWTARNIAAGEKSAWFWERKVLYLCLPLYVFGGLIACVAHWMAILRRNTEHSLWENLRSYAGLILDGFLLPQVLGNLFWDIKETILVPYFYVGITLVRIIPHLYDACRSILYIPNYSSFYFYAIPGWDFYSTAWDVEIPCGALFLALLVFLQQRFGGRCIVPRHFRDYLEYQRIPVVDG